MKTIKRMMQVCILVAFSAIYSMSVNGDDPAILSPLAFVSLAGFGGCGIVLLSHSISMLFEPGHHNGKPTTGEPYGRLPVNTGTTGRGGRDARSAA
ncbi:MAG: hypothetical protein HGA79_01105 [Anaerolineales bacterium]|nr:hypothetical protein [Anaerolineales bacterium]